MKTKRAIGAMGWLLILLAVVALGVGIYLLLAGGSIGSSIPSPPALPA